MIDTDKYEGHTPPDQWTTYKMGADNPHHAVRFGEQGLDLELKFGADAQLIADAPLLLAEVKRLREKLNLIRDTLFYDIAENFTEEQVYDPVLIEIMGKIEAVL